MLGVEQWAEIRRMANVERLSQREIHRRTGIHRDTIRRALAADEPPSYGPRPKRPSKLDPFLRDRAPARRRSRRSRASASARRSPSWATAGGKTILDDCCASCARATCRRRAPTSAPSTAPASSASSTSASRGARSRSATARPAAAHRHRRASLLARLRRRARLLEGVRRHRLGHEPLPCAARRAAGEAGLGPRGRDRAGGQPDRALPRLLRPARARLDRSSTPATARPRARSSAPTASSTATSRPAGASPTRLDFQDQLDRWCDRINARKHRSTRAVVCERLAAERERMRAAARARCPTPTGAG